MNRKKRTIYRLWVKCPKCGAVFRANFYDDFRDKKKTCHICGTSFIVYSRKSGINRIVGFVGKVGGGRKAMIKRKEFQLR